MKARAFSLLEIVIVIGVIAIISVFTAPALSSLINGPMLTRASQTLANHIKLARQYATSKNRPIEVRVLRFHDPENLSGTSGLEQFRAVQLLEVLESGVPVPIGNTEFFPQGIVLCADQRSSLLDPQGQPPRTPSKPDRTDPGLPRGIEKDYEFVSFRYLPNGSTDLAANYSWFMTLVTERDQSTNKDLPANFFLLQIDPVSGKAKEFRPTVQ